MPNVSFAITNALRMHWGRYWKDRPNDEPLDLAETLRNSVVVERSDEFKPAKQGSQLWTHPQLPGVAFVARDNGVEWCVIAILRARRRRPEVVPQVNATETATEAEPMPTFDPIPDDTTAEDACLILAGRIDVVTAWLIRNPKGAQGRALANLAVQSLSRQLDAAKFKRSQERAAAFAANSKMRNVSSGEASELVMTENGKYDLVPAIRWLLREVKELRAKVAEHKLSKGAWPT